MGLPAALTTGPPSQDQPRCRVPLQESTQTWRRRGFVGSSIDGSVVADRDQTFSNSTAIVRSRRLRYSSRSGSTSLATSSCAGTPPRSRSHVASQHFASISPKPRPSGSPAAGWPSTVRATKGPPYDLTCLRPAPSLHRAGMTTTTNPRMTHPLQSIWNGVVGTGLGHWRIDRRARLSHESSHPRLPNRSDREGLAQVGRGATSSSPGVSVRAEWGHLQRRSRVICVASVAASMPDRQLVASLGRCADS